MEKRCTLHFPVTFHIGAFTLPAHLVFELLSYSLGYQYYQHLRRQTTDLISDTNRWWIFIGAAAGASLFSHLLGIVESPLSMHSLSLAYFMGSKTVVGGLLGGLVGVELTKKIIRVHTSSGDLMAYPLIVGMFTGRIGCFLAGLEDGTYGVASSLPWAMDLGDGIRRHPTNLYEMLFLLVLWWSLVRIEKRRALSNGSRFKLFLASYLAFRFLIEFIKPVYTWSIGLSSIQLACLAGILYYYPVFLFPRRTLFAPMEHSPVYSSVN